MSCAPFAWRHLGDELFTVGLTSPSKMPKRTYQEYSAHTKHSILQQYKRGVRGCGFHALAVKYDIHGGGPAVRYWYTLWDGTPHSLQKLTTSHKHRRLDSQQLQQHIRGYVIDMNKQTDPVKYKDVKQNVEMETQNPIAYSTLKRYGYNEANISWKRTTRTLTTDGM